MIPLSLDEVRALARGTLEAAPGSTQITGVQIDSRRIMPGDLFVAVGGGAAYLDEARARRAAATLVPEDAHEALAALAAAVRDRSDARVVGITGSTGKTSTKDILFALCAPHAPTIANERSYNAELGVPLTLCRLEPDTEICIVELAMRGFGQIAELCAIARPVVGVVTNVGPAHLELVGSLEGVIRAKSELIDSLPAGGIAAVPADFPVGRDDIEVIRVGEPEATTDASGTTVRFDNRDHRFDFHARHQARNALTALHTARALGVTPNTTTKVAFSAWRGEERALPGDGLLIVDCWNANPASMRAALEHLAARAGGRRRVAVLGSMAELGAESDRYHREIGEVARASTDLAIAVGEPARAYQADEWLPDAATAATRTRELVEPGDCVLVKGSRAVGLELVAEALTTVSV